MGRKKLQSINPEIGKRLKEYIKDSGKTQKEIADTLGYVPQTISDICRGNRRLTYENALQIKAKIFPEINIEWLFCESDFKTEHEEEENNARVWAERYKFLEEYDKLFRYFISGIEDSQGNGIDATNLKNNILIEDYFPVTDADGKEIGAITLEEFKNFQMEIENYASYQLSLLIKNHMEYLPLPNGRK